MRLRIVTRLALWYSLVLAVIITGLASFLVVRLQAELIRSLDSELSAKVEQIATERAQDARTAEREDLTDVPAVAGLSRGEYLIQEIEPDRSQVEFGNAESATLRFPVSQLRRAARAPVHVSMDVDGEGFRFLAIRLRPGGPAAYLVIAKSLEGVQTTVSHFIILLLLSGPIALAAAFAGGRFLSRRALQPIDHITQVAAAINAEDLSARVEIPAIDDEVARLARTFNAMLANVEGAFDSQRRFLADAAHELRTPLAIMRSEIDVTLRGIPIDDDRRASLESIGDEVDRLVRMAANLLALARVDEGRLDLLRTPVQLDDVASDVIGAMSRLAGERNVSVASSLKSAPIIGDRERVRQVAVNLLDNALRHSPDGGTVRVATGSSAAVSWLRLEDEGPGISDADLDRVFARFYRADDTRARSIGGAGLGLSICRAIVEAHGGTIKLSRGAASGTICLVSLPGPGQEGTFRRVAASNRGAGP